MTPVLFLVFNRPETTRNVFKAIREARPERLFVAADGPRPDRPGEDTLCREVRAIATGVDWPCEVRTLFRDENSGCKKGISGAIDWFFEQVEEGIIIEDDCLPDPSFFHFCTELLERYRQDRHVMMVSGNCHLNDIDAPESYYFSRFAYIWGWATWRDRWVYMDLDLKNWRNRHETEEKLRFLSPRNRKVWLQNLPDDSSKNSSWALAWQFSCWHTNGVCISPTRNLVSNIGDIGVHMKPYDPTIHCPLQPMIFPLKHPPNTTPNIRYDEQTGRLNHRSLGTNLWLITRYVWRLGRKRDRPFFRGLWELWQSLWQEIVRRSSRRPS